MRARGSIASIAVVGVAALVANSEVAFAGPPTITVSSRGERVTATQGSSCWSEAPQAPTITTICGDAAYPLPVRCSLPVKRGAKLTVRTTAPALLVDAFLIGSDGRQRRRLSPKGNDNMPGSRTWRFRLPGAARDAAALDVFGQFSAGDVDTWSGLDTPACRSAGFPRP